jgi:hypothetical protein
VGYDVVVVGIEGNRCNWRDARRHSWHILEGHWLACCSPSTRAAYHIPHTLRGDHKSLRSDQKIDN